MGLQLSRSFSHKKAIWPGWMTLGFCSRRFVYIFFVKCYRLITIFIMFPCFPLFVICFCRFYLPRNRTFSMLSPKPSSSQLMLLLLLLLTAHSLDLSVEHCHPHDMPISYETFFFFITLTNGSQIVHFQYATRCIWLV